MINKCKYCNSTDLSENPRPDTPHYAELKCNSCNKWLSWIKGPNNPRSKSVLNNTKKRDEYRCWFCGRYKNELGTNETMTTDHMIELNEGGKDDLNNTKTLCSACHKLKLWVRTYMNNHLQKFYHG